MKRLMFILLAVGLLAASPAMADEPQEDDAEEVEQTDEADEADDQEDEVADDEDEVVDDEDEVADEEDDQADEEFEDLALDDEPADEPDVDEPAADEPAADHPLLAVAPRIGVTAPQPFGDLNSWPVFGLDVGAIMPFDVGAMQRPLQLGIDVGYTQPGATGEGNHPMLGDEGADYEWELTQRMLTLQLTALWRFMPPGQGFGAHALVGPRVYLMESVMEASGNDADFGENRETNTEYGVVFGGGVEYQLGPGSLVGTLVVSGSPLDQRITGEANTAAFNLDVGYRLFF